MLSKQKEDAELLSRVPMERQEIHMEVTGEEKM
jgi:hypothetical protein